MCENDRRKVFSSRHFSNDDNFLFSFHIYLVVQVVFLPHKKLFSLLLAARKNTEPAPTNTEAHEHKFNFQIIQFSRIAQLYMTNMIAKREFRRASQMNIYARIKSHVLSLFGYAMVRRIALAAMTRECHFVRM